MGLKTLKPRLQVADTRIIKTLDAKAGTTERMRGSRWMKIRRDVLIQSMFTCIDCGLVSASNQIDHDKPLEQGGSHDKSNLMVRCIQCHQAKTTQEAKARAGIK